MAPPWSSLPVDARLPVSLDAVKRAAAEVAALTGALLDGPVKAAVVVPIFERDGEAVLVLIRRAVGLQADPGHIAVPGGHLEPGESPLEAALREAEEEIGLDPASIGSVVALGAYERLANRQLVSAHAAFLEGRPALIPNASEVEAVFEIPVSLLLSDGVAWEEHWVGDFEGERTVAFFADEAALGKDLVWGLTARILWSLLEAVVGVILLDSDVPPPLRGTASPPYREPRSGGSTS